MLENKRPNDVGGNKQHEDRKDNGCFLDDHEVLGRGKVWVVIGDERANDQMWGKAYGEGSG